MEIYLRVLRPFIAESCPELAMPRSALFVTFSGKPAPFGRWVTKFFEKQLGIHITTNTIRSCTEVAAHDLQIDGVISSAERVAISNINGHSSSVVKDHYLKSNRTSDVRRASNVFAKIADVVTEVTDASASSAQLSTELITKSSLPMKTQTIATIPWGTLHPDFGKEQAKYTWTNTEFMYVGKWVDEQKRLHPNGGSFVAKCLKHLQTNESMIPYFHPWHTKSSAKLQYGYDRYKNFIREKHDDYDSEDPNPCDR